MPYGRTREMGTLEHVAFWQLLQQGTCGMVWHKHNHRQQDNRRKAKGVLRWN